MFDVKLVTTTKSTACGPACLAMLLGYYDTEVDLDTLIAECGLSVNGCTAKDMLRVGRAHGMDDFAAFQQTPEDLIRQDRPAIVWWRYNHWVVFCGLNDAGDVVICNPSRGRFAIDQQSFSVMCAGLEDGTVVTLCNGEPEDLPIPEDATAADYEQALSDLGVNV